MSGQQPNQPGIVNDALAELGSTARITSIDDKSGPAPDAKAVWDGMVRHLLADHPWNWAVKRTQLNAAAEKPGFGYLRAFTLPADCLRWLPPSREDGDAHFEGVEEGGQILTDAAAPLPVRYISSTKALDIASWPPFFVEAVMLDLAARLAEPITQDESIKDRMLERAMRALKKAKRRDGQSSGNRTRNRVSQGSDWLAARDAPYYGRAPGR